MCLIWRARAGRWSILTRKVCVCMCVCFKSWLASDIQSERNTFIERERGQGEGLEFVNICENPRNFCLNLSYAKIKSKFN